MSSSSREFVVKEGLRLERYEVRSNYLEFDVEGWQQFLAEQISKEIDREILNDLLAQKTFEPEKITRQKLQDIVLTWRFRF